MSKLTNHEAVLGMENTEGTVISGEGVGTQISKSRAAGLGWERFGSGDTLTIPFRGPWAEVGILQSGHHRRAVCLVVPT
jgi:hypothetical protein